MKKRTSALVLLALSLFPGIQKPIFAQNIPDDSISRVEYRLCGVVLFGETCQRTATAYFWGNVEGIHIFKVGDYWQAHVKSQGCFGYYGEPQKTAWYPLSPFANPAKNQTPTATIVSQQLLSASEKAQLVSAWQQTGLAFSGQKCTPYVNTN